MAECRTQVYSKPTPFPCTSLKLLKQETEAHSCGPWDRKAQLLLLLGGEEALPWIPS